MKRIALAYLGIVNLAAIAIDAASQQPAARSAKSGGGGDSTPGALSRGKPRYGIFGFGSLINDPGAELTKATVSRQDLETPFAVEYGRSSNTRGGAPTLVPVKTGGAKVKATVFMLKDSISEQEAEDVLYRRELHQVGSGRTYDPSAKPGKNSIVIAAWPNLIGLKKIFYTDFAIPESSRTLRLRYSPGWRSTARAIVKCPRGTTASAI
jgi:hypothetical protein